ncbi:MAG: TIGR03960 family B12-binding radical SAM protein [Myxococcota bacterium]|nr:TIGR03960 family B12-binding radical SAM protein [Myxococcota bacterium]
MFTHPYAPFLLQVERPGRYVGGEFGAVKTPSAADLRLLLAFPDIYEIGMSHMGISILYEIVNGLPGLSAERVFMPWPDLEAALTRHGVPLVSLESASPLRDFDIVGFSLQYELCYTNMLAMLALGGIPRRADARQAGDPLVIVGGPVATHAEPIAPFVDLCLVGDGEQALPELLNQALACKKRGLSRSRTIEHLHGLPAVFSPGLLARKWDLAAQRMVVSKPPGPTARRARVDALGHHPTGFGPVPTVQAVFDRYSIEVARGCTAGCRFCQAGFLNRPVRERDAQATLQSALRAIRCLGSDEISLAALSTADHSDIGPMVSSLGQTLTPERVSLSVPSLRAYGLPDDVVEVLSRLRAGTITLAPEAGTQRLRDVINKNVTEADLLDAAARFFDGGFTRMKLYFMIGLPSETDADVGAIIDLAKQLCTLGQKRLRGRRPRVVVSVSTFVPKPFTPFERDPMIGLEEIRAKHALLKDLAKRARIELRVHAPELSVLEGILSRADITIAPLLERAVDQGARFDGWTEMFKASVWDPILADIDVQAMCDEIPQQAGVPWDHIDVGIDPAFLASERQRARTHKPTPQCGRYTPEKGDRIHTICHGCGMACPMADLPLQMPRSIIQSSTPSRPSVPATRAPRASAIIKDAGAMRYRLFFAKWGRHAFIGHLDTMRHIVRSLRRAGLDLVYTRGFHPKPKIESAPPLPLGISGLCEPLDVQFIDPPGEAEILDRLGQAVPPDMAFVAVQALDPGAPSLSKQITGAEYIALVAAPRNWVAQGIAHLLAAESLFVNRTKKHQLKSVDIRPFLKSASLLDTGLQDLHLPTETNRIAIKFFINMPGSGTARPFEIATAIVPNMPEDPWVVRTRIALRHSDTSTTHKICTHQVEKLPI